jgi:hypothetical protein
MIDTTIELGISIVSDEECLDHRKREMKEREIVDTFWSSDCKMPFEYVILEWASAK